ncbi:MAG: ChaN family lipoprotein, partial [Candidatus Rokuibacteriota bacterium]
MIPRRRVLAGALGTVALAACGPLVAVPPRPWQSPEGRDHPLSGRVWDPAADRFVRPSALVERLAQARFVLLGERHDNADHHRLQGWIVEALAKAGRRPAVAFEMLTVEDTHAVARHLASAPGDAAGLGAAVGWEKSGWPPWPLYQPIAEAAIAARLPIVGANLTPAATRAVREQGLAGIDRVLAARTGVDRPLDPAVRASLVAEIREAHCGHGSDAMLDRMAAVQVARDAQMADALATAGERDGAVLIAGAGHVRTD